MVDSLSTVLKNGENSLVEFKLSSVSPQTLAEEISAFANTRGGDIYIGVNDDGEVTGIDPDRKNNLEHTVMNICRTSILPPLIPLFETIGIDDKMIARIRIHEGLEKPYQTASGKYMVRVGSTKRNASREELVRLFQNAGVHHIDANPVASAGKEDLDLDKITAYFRDVYELNFDELTPADRDKLLVNASIAAIIRSELHPSLAGLLFFGRQQKVFGSIEKHLPRAGIHFVSYADDDMDLILDRSDCHDPLPQAVDAVIYKMRLNWKTSSVIKGLKREERRFPEGIFRELLVNAVVHRDYSIQGGTQIRMFPEKTEIINPGRLINTVTIEKMKAGISISRNPIILKFMQNYRYADQLGRGVPMVVRKVTKTPGMAFEMEESESSFKAVLTYRQWPGSDPHP